MVGNIERFKRVIIENSAAGQNYDECIKLWKVYSFYDNETNCICGHPIFHNCVIKHVRTGKTLIVGNHCIFKVGTNEQQKVINKHVRSTFDCVNCNYRFDKSLDNEEHLCHRCHPNCKICVDCQIPFLCQGRERHYQHKCTKCHFQSKGEIFRGIIKRFSPTMGKKCLICKCKIPRRDGSSTHLYCLKHYDAPWKRFLRDLV